MKETVYFGTYTRWPQGFYKADFDTETVNSNLELFCRNQAQIPLALIKTKDLYTVGSHDGKGGIQLSD